jgi:hypothetical protein
MNLIDLYNSRGGSILDLISTYNKKLQEEKKRVFFSAPFRKKLIDLMSVELIGFLVYLGYYADDSDQEMLYRDDYDNDERHWNEGFINREFPEMGEYINYLMYSYEDSWIEMIELGLKLFQGSIDSAGVTLINYKTEYDDNYYYHGEVWPKEPFEGTAEYLYGIFLEHKEEILEKAKYKALYDLLRCGDHVFLEKDESFYLSPYPYQYVNGEYVKVEEDPEDVQMVKKKEMVERSFAYWKEHKDEGLTVHDDPVPSFPYSLEEQGVVITEITRSAIDQIESLNLLAQELEPADFDDPVDDIPEREVTDVFEVEDLPPDTRYDDSA